MERTNKLYEISCDFPGIEKHFAIVLLDYCQKTDSRDVIDGIAFDEKFYENEEAEFILEFYQEMLRQMRKTLDEEDYKDLKEKIGTKKLKKLAKRVRLNDFDSL